MQSDGELLRSYVESRSEAAFTELVNRHLNLVYRSARRRVGGNAHSADDVTLRVFAQLARKAPALVGHPSLVGWLYTATRFTAAAIVRAEHRRQAYEQKAHAMHSLHSSAAESNARLEPLLDDVMDILPDADRQAVLLHFFEGRSFSEVGEVLAVTPDAARMRVNRAIERVRAGFARRGIASTAAALGAVLATQSASAAPAGLAAAAVQQALQQTMVSGVAAFGWRVLQVVKSTPFAVSTGAAAAVALGVATWQAQHSKPDPEVFAETGFSDANVVVAAPAGSAPGAAAAGEFAALTDEERNILAMLWRAQERIVDQRGRASLHVGSRAPNASGIAPLVNRGLASLDPRTGNVLLTGAGRAFCARNREAVERHTIQARLRNP